MLSHRITNIREILFHEWIVTSGMWSRMFLLNEPIMNSAMKRRANRSNDGIDHTQKPIIHRVDHSLDLLAVQNSCLNVLRKPLNTLKEHTKCYLYRLKLENESRFDPRRNTARTHTATAHLSEFHIPVASRKEAGTCQRGS